MFLGRTEAHAPHLQALPSRSGLFSLLGKLDFAIPKVYVCIAAADLLDLLDFFQSSVLVCIPSSLRKSTEFHSIDVQPKLRLRLQLHYRINGTKLREPVNAVKPTADTILS